MLLNRTINDVAPVFIPDKDIILNFGGKQTEISCMLSHALVAESSILFKQEVPCGNESY